MPCDLMSLREQERLERKKAVEELERQLLSGEKMLVRDPITGEQRVEGWETTYAAATGWQEGCAMAYLAEHGSWELQTSLGASVKEQLKAQHGGGGGHGHGHGHGGDESGGGW